MVYYVILYFIRSFLSNRLWLAFAITSVLLVIWYIFCFDHKEINHLYKTGQYYIYFIFMLQGAMIGIKGKPKCRPLVDTVMLLLCIVVWYGLQLIGEGNPAFSQSQIITIIPLLGFTYYLYKIANTEAMARLYNNKVCHWVIMTISGLCLEVYLCQGAVITRNLNHLFPINLLIVFFGVLVLAYMVRTVGRWFAQTFRKEDYDWREIVKL